MKKVIKYYAYVIFLGLVFVCNHIDVSAAGEAYEFSVSAYNVTSACDLDAIKADGGVDCYLDAVDGNLEANKITDSLIKADQVIMALINYRALNPDTSIDIGGFQFKLLYDSTMMSPIYSDDLEDYASVGIDVDDTLMKTVFPVSGRNKWDFQLPVFNSGYVSQISVNNKTGKAMIKNEDETPILAVFFQVNSDISSGAETELKLDTSKPNPTNFSDLTGNTVTIENNIKLAGVKLSTGGASTPVDNDATLKSLTVTGNNGKTYLLNPTFVPSSENDIVYNIVVPNSVTSIKFEGETTKPVNATNGLGVDHSLEVGDQVIMIKVTAADATTSISYTFNVKRLSNDATLKSISAKYTLDGVDTPIDFGVLGASLEYNATSNVPYKTTNAIVSLVPNYENAIIADKNPTWTINTDDSTDYKNTYTVNVKSEECNPVYASVPGISTDCTGNNYKFNITRTAPSKNLNLATLSVGGKNITIDNTKSSYDVVIEQTRSSVDISATLEDNKNTISGTGNKSISLGDNTFTLTATSEDGKTTKDYTINVHRARKELKNLTITTTPDNGILKPGFNATANKNYTYEYPATATKVSVVATVLDTDYAYVNIVDRSSDTSPAAKGSLNTLTKDFTTIPSKIEVIVTSADGSIDNYMITLDRQKSTNNLLKNLSITPGAIKETFSKEKTNYTAEVDSDVTSVTVNAEADDDRSTLGTITGNTNLNFGTNTITIPVRSESGSEKTYTIVVTRKESEVATLDDLKLGLGSDTPTTVTGFNKNVFSYDLYKKGVNEVPFTTTSVNIEYTKGNEYQTVTGDIGVKNLVPGENTFTIRVAPQKSSAPNKTYTIKIYRAKNSDNETKGVVVAGVAATQRADKNYEVTLPNSKSSLTPNEVVITISNDATLTKTTSNLNLSTTSLNEFNYFVTSESGDVEYYKIFITREKSTDTNISNVSLKLDGESDYARSCLPKVISGKTNKGCTIEVPSGTTGYNLRAAINSAASINPVNETHYDMLEDSTSSIQEHTLTVTAEDGTTTESYDITVKREQSSNSYLKEIKTNANSSVLNNIAGFNETTPAYNLEVDASQTSIEVNATASDPKSIVNEIGLDGSVTENTNSDKSKITFTRNLLYNDDNGGSANVIKIQVTSEKGNKSTYILNVTRKANTDATLKEITLNSTKEIDVSTCGRETNGLYAGKIICEVSDIFDYETSSLYVTAENNDAKGSYRELSSSTNGAFSADLNTIYYGKDFTASEEYTNVISIRSFAHDISVYEDYLILAKRRANSNTEVEKVEVYFDGALHELSKNGNTYEIEVPNEINKITKGNGNKNGDIVVTVKDPRVPSRDAYAKYEMNDKDLVTKDITLGNVNIHVFKVIAEDGTEKDYSLRITRSKSNDARLNDIIVESYKDDQALDNGMFGRPFNKNNAVQEYTINVPEGTNKVKLNIEKSEENSINDAAGEYTLNSSERQIVIQSFAEDGSGPVTYILNIKRAANAEDYLKNVQVSDTSGNTYPVKFADGSDFVGPLTSNTKLLKVEVPGEVEEVLLDAEATTPLATVSYELQDSGSTNKYTIAPNSTKRAGITIESESGHVQTFYLDIIRKPRTVAKLSNLSYTTIAADDTNVTNLLIEDTAGDIVYDSVTVANKFSQINIIANVDAESGATLSGNTGLLPIVSGENTYVLTVTAEDGITKKNYTIKINREFSDEARLKALDVTGIILDKTFDKDIFEYNLEIPEDKETFSCNDLTYEKLHSEQTVACDGEISITNGDTKAFKITVMPESQKEEHKKIYILNVTRALSKNNYLKSVTITGGTLSQSFDKTKNNYSIAIPESNTSGDFTLKVVKDNELANISPNEDELLVGKTYNVSDNTIEIEVRAQDPNVPVRKYTFTITRAKSHDASLDNLSVTGYPFTENFRSSLYDYTLNSNLDRNIKQLTINAIPRNINAKIEYKNNDTILTECENKTNCKLDLSSLSLGSYKITVTVTPEDEDDSAKKIYTIDYQITRSEDNYLTDLEVTNKSLEQIAFNQNIKDYEITVDNEIEEVELKIVPCQFASVSVDGNLLPSDNLVTINNIPEGSSKRVTILVTSENGQVNKYTVTINRLGAILSSDNFLAGLEVDGYPFDTEFSSTNSTYSIGEIPWSTTEITVNPKKNTDTQRIEYYVNDEKQTSNVLNIPKQENVTITVKVIAEDGTPRDYTISLTKTADSETSLLNIVVDKGALTPEFNEDNTNYEVTIPNDEDSINITATAKNTKQILTLNGESYTSGTVKTISGISEGATETVTIIVTSEYGTTKTYSVKITREDETEQITSIIHGHTIEDGYIKTVGLEKSVTTMKDQLDNDNSKLEIWNATDTEKLGEDDIVGTGCIVKLIKNGEIIDQKTIVIKGDTDGDGYLDMNDAGPLVNHFMKRVTLEGAFYLAADTDEDGTIDMNDAGPIVNHYMKRFLIEYKD